MRVGVYNTHLDDGGVRSRVEACKLILRTMGESSLPAVLMGDFNLTPDEEPASDSEGGVDGSGAGAAA